jgi:hypothetical protein
MRPASSFSDAPGQPAVRRFSPLSALVLIVLISATTGVTGPTTAQFEQYNVSTLATISRSPVCLAPVNDTHVAFSENKSILYDLTY